MATVEKEKPVTGECEAAKGEDIFSYFNSVHQDPVNPNDFWEKEKSRTMIEQVRAMDEADPRLWGMMDTRKQAVIGLDRQITGEGKEADFVREVFKGIKNFSDIIMQMMDAIPCGFSPVEIIWNYLGGKVVIEDLKPRCPDKFFFDADWKLRLSLGAKTDGELMPEKKFLVFSWRSRYGNRYGEALYQKIYWYWYIAKNITKFWSIFSEKHGSPTVIGKLPKGNANPDDVAAVKSFVKNIKNHAGITLPDGFAVELLEAQRSGSIDTFERFAKWLENGMAIAILGQTGTTESSDSGSYAKVAAQDIVRQDIIKADITFLESVINDYLIRWLVDYNFENVKDYPKWHIIYDEKPDIKMLADVTSILVNAGDDQIPLSWIHKKVGIPEVEEGEPVFSRAPAPAVPTFAEFQFRRDQEIFLKEARK
jgi:phage gp29-like protein